MKNICKILLIITFWLSGDILSAQINFAPQVLYNSSQGNNVHVTADFDNDGLSDIIVATGGTSISKFYLWMFKQQSGQLNLHDSMKYTTTNYLQCYSISSGDLNNNGRKDIILSYGDTVKIFYQDTVIGFFNENNSQIFVPDSGMVVYGLECGDLNGDGLTDFAVTHWLNENLNVYYQNANQGFTKVVYYKKIAGRNELIVSDMNNDGFQDLIVSNGTVFSSLSNGNMYSFAIYLQDTTSHLLQPPLFYAMDTLTPNSWNSNYCGGIAVGDLDQDGLKDVVVTREQETFIWHHVAGNPVFLMNPIDTLNSYLGSAPVVITDLNNDSKNEIIVSHGGHSDISVYESDSAFNFSNYSLLFQWNASNNCQDEFSVTDMNNDGWVDLITSHELGFAIRFNNQGVGLNDAFSDNINFTIYPNPILEGILNVQYLLPQNTTAIFELFDITGKVVFKDELRGFESQESFILPNLNNGIYFAMVTAEGIRKISKVVILSKT